jgi:hypothetical protein
MKLSERTMGIYVSLVIRTMDVNVSPMVLMHGTMGVHFP